MANMDIPGLPDLSILRQLARDQLVMHLESLAGRKDLVLDRELMKPLDRVAGASLLKEHGVDKIFKLEPASRVLEGCDQRIYIVRPKVATIKYIADQINADRNNEVKRVYRVFFVPRKLHVCEQIFEQEGVFGYVTVDEFQLDLIQLDLDILSLELPEFFKSFYLEKDYTWCHTAARSLVQLQQVLGLIPDVHMLGKCSKVVKGMMDILFEDQGKPAQLNSEIGQLFLVDRDMDLITPLCTQVTYEGLLDDTFGIDSGFIEFGKDVTGQEKSIKLLLTSSDDVFEDIRNKHISSVFSFLSLKAKTLQTGYDKRKDIKTVTDMKNFVSNDLKGLKQQHKSLTLHISACESIMSKKAKGDFEDTLRAEHSILEGVETKENINYLEEMMGRQLNSISTLKLLCLLSLTQDGLSSSNYKSLKTQFLQSHGFEHLLTFHNLKKLGLMVTQDTALPQKQFGNKMAALANIPKSSQFRNLNKKLNLVPKSADTVNLKDPREMAYVFSGAYTPMICKVIEQVLDKASVTAMDDIVKLLPGECTSQKGARSMKGLSGQGGPNSQSPTARVIMVYFLGGCTFSEIAALRLLGKIKRYQFIIATTSITTGTKLIESLVETS